MRDGATLTSLYPLLSLRRETSAEAQLQRLLAAGQLEAAAELAESQGLEPDSVLRCVATSESSTKL